MPVEWVGGKRQCQYANGCPLGDNCRDFDTPMCDYDLSRARMAKCSKGCALVLIVPLVLIAYGIIELIGA